MGWTHYPFGGLCCCPLDPAGPTTTEAEGGLRPLAAHSPGICRWGLRVDPLISQPVRVKACLALRQPPQQHSATHSVRRHTRPPCSLSLAGTPRNPWGACCVWTAAPPLRTPCLHRCRAAGLTSTHSRSTCSSERQPWRSRKCRDAPWAHLGSSGQERRSWAAPSAARLAQRSPQRRRQRRRRLHRLHLRHRPAITWRCL